MRIAYDHDVNSLAHDGEEGEGASGHAHVHMPLPKNTKITASVFAARQGRRRRPGKKA